MQSNHVSVISGMGDEWRRPLSLPEQATGANIACEVSGDCCPEL